MHQAALLGQALRDSRNYGWNVEETIKHDWERMTEAVQNHIGSLNWGYRVALREKKSLMRMPMGSLLGLTELRQQITKAKKKFIQQRNFSLPLVKGHAIWVSLVTKSTASAVMIFSLYLIARVRPWWSEHPMSLWNVLDFLPASV